MTRLIYTIFLIVAFSLIRRFQEVLPFFLLLILFVFGLLVNFRLFEKMIYFIRQDIKHYNLDRLDLTNRLILALLWVVAVLVVRKAGGVWWLFGVFDNGTLLFFILLGFLILFKSSSSTSALISIALISYSAFFNIYKFAETADLFAILTFFLFAWTVLQEIKEQVYNI
ncbi:hypothetical protein HY612_00885 [Candidatus Roizmanbacteria bacterium]|nr:hypothetical protein [Candidatus Roizmanbacteria bacterium]